jgi:Ceramidase
MQWSAQIFGYCERGSSSAFWAEPFNAVSNAAFIFAAVLAVRDWRQNWRHVDRGQHDVTAAVLIGLVFVIGIGSFLFHTFATRWALFADTAPITIFMIGYLGTALRRFVGLPWSRVSIAIVVFLAAGAALETISCDGGRCLNGSLGYAPALVALFLIAVSLRWSSHPAAQLLLGAAVIFTCSLGFRSIDQLVCAHTLVQPNWKLGTHAVWHLANAVVLYLLLSAVIKFGRNGVK